ncbi:MAG: hypothetical protein D6824_08345, partial [Planctomycetota bacterium]
GQGRTVDFRNTIVVMTSNIGSQQIQELAGRGAESWEIEAAVREQLKQHLRPELLNRIDETIVFHQLTKEQIVAIVDIQLQRLAQRLADRGVSVELTEAARSAVAEEGWDPVFGARPLKRVIQRRIENALATELLSGRIKEGDHVVIDYAGKTFTFTPRRDAERPAQTPPAAAAGV